MASWPCTGTAREHPGRNRSLPAGHRRGREEYSGCDAVIERRPPDVLHRGEIGRFRRVTVAVVRNTPAAMRLSSDDLPMFFTDAHAQLAERLRAAVPAIEAVEAAGPETEAARDQSAVAALARTGLFELVVPRAAASDERGEM